MLTEAQAPNLVGFFAPHRCSGCGDIGVSLCSTCEGRLRPAGDRARIASVRRIVVAWTYEGAARRLILDLKVAGRRDAAQPLVAAMCRAVRREGVLGSVITWVPARPKDVLRRGFDHAEVLARGLSERVGLPCRRLLYTSDAHADQSTLGAAERRRNLEGAFLAATCAGRIILVDDLITTGATASACAAALRAGGAASIELVASSSA